VKLTGSSKTVAKDLARVRMPIEEVIQNHPQITEKIHVMFEDLQIGII